MLQMMRLRASRRDARVFAIPRLMCAVVVLCSFAGQALQAAAQDKGAAPLIEPRALVRALQAGGHVIYFRHAATDHTQMDANRVDLQNCATQRNLSEKGKEQARNIGKVFKSLDIKVGEVLASPYCRCIDTAKLAFGKATAMQDLEFAISKPEAEAKRLAAALRKVLQTKPSRGMNTVVVAHTANLKEAAGIWPKAEGDAHVFRPQENGGFVHVGSVRAEEWLELAKSN